MQPYVALGVGLKKAGYQVSIPSSEVFRPLISEAGLEFIPILGFDPMEFIRTPEIQAAVRVGGQFNILFSLLRKARPLLESLFDEYWRNSESADILIASTLVFGIPDCAEKRGIPLINAPIQSLLTPTRAFPASFFAPFGTREYGPGNYLTHRVVQFAFWLMFRGALNHWRQKMQLPKITNYFKQLHEHGYLSVYGFSPNILPRPKDWPSNQHVTGYWFLDQPANWQPPNELIRFLGKGPAPVYVGFGSMDVQDPLRMTRLVVDALSESGQRGVLASGWGGLSTQGLPDTIFPIREIPHSWLFPRMAALVHHGGMGTTAAGLRAGIPAVIVPLGGDQPFWADRLLRLGVGVRSAGYFKVTSRQLAADVRRVMNDTAMRSKTIELGEKIRAERGVDEAVELIQAHC